MSWSFCFNIVVCIGSLYGAWLDHWDTFNAFRSTKGEERKQRAKKLILLWGLPVFSIAALPFTAWESVASNRELAETREAVSTIDPANRRIASLTASAVILVEGTNRTHIDPSDFESGNGKFVNLMIGGQEQLKADAGWPALLHCSSFEHAISRSETGADMWWYLDFGPPGLGMLNVVTNDTVKAANEWNAIRLNAPFLPRHTKILAGELTVTINGSLKRRFHIPPQTTKSGGETMSMLNAVTVYAW